MADDDDFDDLDLDELLDGEREDGGLGSRSVTPKNATPSKHANNASGLPASEEAKDLVFSSEEEEEEPVHMDENNEGGGGWLMLTWEGGHQVLLDPSVPEVKIGKRSDNDIVVKSKMISKYHCFIEYGRTLGDNNSKNGTKLNGKKISRAGLKAGDQIEIGALKFQVSHAPASMPAQAAEETEKNPEPHLEKKGGMQKGEVSLSHEPEEPGNAKPEKGNQDAAFFEDLSVEEPTVRGR
mmetsp:Transcript_15834/g.32204  ORF Transcript_15834/g.32204 Transcript_15834/m.32204 type:complete len:238 (-) Transcript_15834:1816-2529(-)